MAFAVGLTGGIGSGKSTVAVMFATQGADVVDADEISRRLTAPAQPAVTEIARKFGSQFVGADGEFDRTRMRSLIFSNPAARKDLEAILHPLIRQESMRQLHQSKSPYVVMVVPLLFESGAYRDMVNRILVVDCEPETQVRRVMERSQLSRNEVLSIIASQISRERRLSGADDIIHNEDGLEALGTQVLALHRRYLGLAANA
jgi:dephospho-CoA kinase